MKGLRTISLEHKLTRAIEDGDDRLVVKLEKEIEKKEKKRKNANR